MRNILMNGFKRLPKNAAKNKRLCEAALSALREAEAREKARLAAANALPSEQGGRKDGLEPTRYGDWEVAGRACDF